MMPLSTCIFRYATSSLVFVSLITLRLTPHCVLYLAYQEFAENSADFQHFDPLHGQMCLPFTLIPIPGMRIIHEAGTLS